MSTTPSTFDDPSGQDPVSSGPGTYTVVGGSKAGHTAQTFRLSLLLLNRSGKLFTPGSLQDLKRMGFDDILAVEGPGLSYDVESLSRKHPTVRFLLLQKKLTLGEVINLGIQEARGTFVFVLWNDMSLLSGGLSSLVVERLFKNQQLCTVPVLQNLRGEVLPTLQAPAFARRYLKVLNLSPAREGRLSLFPFDMTGIYHTEKFLLTGGFDPLITNPYWQRLDFGFRAHLWGESIKCETALRLKYLGEPPIMETSPDDSYLRFYLKNLSVRYNGEAGYIPLSRFWSYLWKREGSFFKARREFREVRNWVELHRFRFQFDATSITDLWEAGDL